MKDKKFYTGYTDDLRKRLSLHNAGKVRATKGRDPLGVVYYEACKNKDDALARERYLKSGPGKRYLNNRLKRFLSLTGLVVVFLASLLAPNVTHASLTDGLVGYWKFDEGSGTTATDSSGSRNNGTLTNGPTWTTGKVGSGAVSLDGIDDYVNIPANKLLGATAASFGIWFNTVDSNGSLLSEYHNHSTYSHRIDIVGGKLGVCIGTVTDDPDCGNSTYLATSVNTVNDGQWHFAFAVYDGTKIHLFLDGSEIANANKTGTINGAVGNSNFIGVEGFNNGGTPYVQGVGYLSGSVDDARIYARALSASEVQDLYQIGAPGATNQPPTVSAGSNQTITLPGRATLSGSASDDGLPTSSTLVVTWSKHSGPGTVSFDNTNSANTVATFSTAGVYQLNLTATDGALASVSSVTVTVNFAQSSYAGPDWYVSPTGVPNGDGSINNPWDLQTAIADNTNPANRNYGVKPGHTIWLRQGTYISPSQVNSGGVLTRKLFLSKVSGTQSAPVTVRQYAGERATIDGGIESTGAWVAFRGFEIMNSDTNRTVCPSERPGGLNLLARGNKVINMIIHDTGHPGIGFWNPVGDGGELYGNIVWANGVYDTCTPPGTPDKPWTRRSGFYMQNETGSRYITDNISFWNGMKAYGENTSGFDFEGNVLFNQTYANLEVVSNGLSTKRLKLINNYTYRERTDGGYGVMLGIFSSVYGIGDDVEVRGNYFVNGDIQPWPDANGSYPGPVLGMNNFADVTFLNNTIVGSGLDWAVDTLRPLTQNWNNNYYWINPARMVHPNNAFGYYTAQNYTNFNYWDTRSFDEWKARCNCDVSSSFAFAYPTINRIDVRPNKYEPGRAHIIIYNWQKIPNVLVDVSAVLGVGDSYEVRDAQNYFGAPVLQGVYGGGQISLPMNLTQASVAVGNYVDVWPHTSLEFNVFVLIKTASGGVTPPPSSPVSGSCSTTLNTCTAGTLSDTADNATDYLWSCLGSNGGTTASCSLPIPPSPDTTAPTVSITAPASGSTVSGSVTLSANASDPVVSGQTTSGISTVQFKLDNADLGVFLTTPPYSGTWNTSGVGNGSHTLSAVARDIAGNRATSTVSITVSNPTADITPPSVPANLTATPVSPDQINLSWSAAVDPTIAGQTNSGLSGYKLYRSGTLISTLTTTSYSDTSLNPATVYTYTVLSYDQAGNQSAASSPVSAATEPLPPPPNPPAPTGGSPSGTLSVNTASATLSLTTDIAATCRYGSQANTAYGSLPNTFTATGNLSHTTTVNGLANGVSYTYYVRCQSSAGLAMDGDYIISFSVAAPVTTPTPPPAAGGGGSAGSSGGGGGGGGGGSPTGSFTPSVPQLSLVSATSSPSSISSTTNYQLSTTNSSCSSKLTSSQIQSILNLLSAFNADQTIIGKVHNALCGITTSANSQILISNSQSSSNFQFTRNLKLGQTDPDVKQLQSFLNNHGFRISYTGVGSIGKETTYFGPATYQALVKFQEFYASKILTPNNLTKGTGFFGSATIKVVNEMME